MARIADAPYGKAIPGLRIKRRLGDKILIVNRRTGEKIVIQPVTLWSGAQVSIAFDGKPEEFAILRAELLSNELD